MVVDTELLRNAIVTHLLFFVTEGEQVRGSDYDDANEIAIDIIRNRMNWLEAAGQEHKLVIENPKRYESIRPKSKYAALAGTALGKLNIDLAMLSEWAVNVGESICHLLSIEGKEVDSQKLPERMELFYYINSCQTTKPVPFKKGDMRKFFRKGFSGTLDLID